MHASSSLQGPDSAGRFGLCPSYPWQTMHDGDGARVLRLDWALEVAFAVSFCVKHPLGTKLSEGLAIVRHATSLPGALRVTTDLVTT